MNDSNANSGSPDGQDPHASGDVTNLARRAWRAAMQATGTLTAIFDVEMRASAGMDVQTYDALLHIFESGDTGIQMSDLAREIVLSKAGLTALVDRLEKRSLVRREPDPGDRRAVRIKLTHDGDQAFRAAAHVHLAGIRERVTQHLTDEEARVIAEAFERLRRVNLEGAARGTDRLVPQQSS